jgi:uncharacterized protein (DUF433 family)
MKSAETETVPQAPAEIIDRGRGPEIKGTRITVYDVVDYVLEGWHPAQIATWFRLSSVQIEAAVAYFREHRIEVLREYVKILERAARGNPPEVEAKAEESHRRTQELIRQIREARARSDAEIRELIRRHQQAGQEGNNNAGPDGGQ